MMAVQTVATKKLALLRDIYSFEDVWFGLRF